MNITIEFGPSIQQWLDSEAVITIQTSTGPKVMTMASLPFLIELEWIVSDCDKDDTSGPCYVYDVDVSGALQTSGCVVIPCHWMDMVNNYPDIYYKIKEAGDDVWFETSNGNQEGRCQYIFENGTSEPPVSLDTTFVIGDVFGCTDPTATNYFEPQCPNAIEHVNHIEWLCQYEECTDWDCSDVCCDANSGFECWRTDCWGDCLPANQIAEEDECGVCQGIQIDPATAHCCLEGWGGSSDDCNHHCGYQQQLIDFWECLHSDIGLEGTYHPDCDGCDSHARCFNAFHDCRDGSFDSKGEFNECIEDSLTKSIKCMTEMLSEDANEIFQEKVESWEQWVVVPSNTFACPAPWNESGGTGDICCGGYYESVGGSMYPCSSITCENMCEAFSENAGETSSSIGCVNDDGYSGVVYNLGQCILWNPAPQTLGCTDCIAQNYNPDATEDDGSCEYYDCDACLYYQENLWCQGVDCAQCYCQEGCEAAGGIWQGAPDWNMGGPCCDAAQLIAIENGEWPYSCSYMEDWWGFNCTGCDCTYDNYMGPESGGIQKIINKNKVKKSISYNIKGKLQRSDIQNRDENECLINGPVGFYLNHELGVELGPGWNCKPIIGCHDVNIGMMSLWIGDSTPYVHFDYEQFEAHILIEVSEVRSDIMFNVLNLNMCESTAYWFGKDLNIIIELTPDLEFTTIEGYDGYWDKYSGFTGDVGINLGPSFFQDWILENLIDGFIESLRDMINARTYNIIIDTLQDPNWISMFTGNRSREELSYWETITMMNAFTHSTGYYQSSWWSSSSDYSIDYCVKGDMNNDGGWNVLDIVTLANCVLAGNCAELEYGTCGDLNGDGGYNVLDVVTLANCVLAGDCGGRVNGNPDLDTRSTYAPPRGMLEEVHTGIIQKIVNTGKDINKIKSILDKEVPQHIIKGGRTTPTQNYDGGRDDRTICDGPPCHELLDEWEIFGESGTIPTVTVRSYYLYSLDWDDGDGGKSEWEHIVYVFTPDGTENNTNIPTSVLIAGDDSDAVTNYGFGTAGQMGVDPYGPGTVDSDGGPQWECLFSYLNSYDCILGDLNGDGGFNVLDIVTLANCVLAGNCADLECGCAGDLNGDGGYNVLDIVTLANCVLAGDCGGRVNGNPDLDTEEAYKLPPGMTPQQHEEILLDIVNGPQDIHRIKNVLNPILDIVEINEVSSIVKRDRKSTLIPSPLNSYDCNLCTDKPPCNGGYCQSANQNSPDCPCVDGGPGADCFGSCVESGECPTGPCNYDGLCFSAELHDLYNCPSDPDDETYIKIGMVTGLAYLSTELGTSLVYIDNIPNQPLMGGKKEDELMIESLYRTMNGGDNHNILKTSVNAVKNIFDVFDDNSEFSYLTKKYVLSGASKRGWISWLVAGRDDRVVALIPMVWSAIDVKEAFIKHKEVDGTWGGAIPTGSRDYMDAIYDNLISISTEDHFLTKWNPKYCAEYPGQDGCISDALDIPIHMINAAGDEFIPITHQEDYSVLPGFIPYNEFNSGITLDNYNFVSMDYINFGHYMNGMAKSPLVPAIFEYIFPSLVAFINIFKQNYPNLDNPTYLPPIYTWRITNSGRIELKIAGDHTDVQLFSARSGNMYYDFKCCADNNWPCNCPESCDNCTTSFLIEPSYNGYDGIDGNVNVLGDVLPIYKYKFFDCILGDLNGDGGFNVLDIVTLVNCVMAGNCADLEYGCAGDMNGDGGYNVLDIVTLANCVSAGDCGGRVNGNPDLDLQQGVYDPPPGMTPQQHEEILLDIVNGPQDIHRIKNVLNPILDIVEINEVSSIVKRDRKSTLIPSQSYRRDCDNLPEEVGYFDECGFQCVIGFNDYLNTDPIYGIRGVDDNECYLNVKIVYNSISYWDSLTFMIPHNFSLKIGDFDLGGSGISVPLMHYYMPAVCVCRKDSESVFQSEAGATIYEYPEGWGFACADPIYCPCPLPCFNPPPPTSECENWGYTFGGCNPTNNAGGDININCVDNPFGENHDWTLIGGDCTFYNFDIQADGVKELWCGTKSGYNYLTAGGDDCITSGSCEGNPSPHYSIAVRLWDGTLNLGEAEDWVAVKTLTHDGSLITQHHHSCDNEMTSFAITFDCMGEIYGTAEEDCAGVCEGGNVMGGTECPCESDSNLIDECGICDPNGDGSTYGGSWNQSCFEDCLSDGDCPQAFYLRSGKLLNDGTECGYNIEVLTDITKEVMKSIIKPTLNNLTDDLNTFSDHNCPVDPISGYPNIFHPDFNYMNCLQDLHEDFGFEDCRPTDLTCYTIDGNTLYDCATYHHGWNYSFYYSGCYVLSIYEDTGEYPQSGNANYVSEGYVGQCHTSDGLDCGWACTLSGMGAEGVYNWYNPIVNVPCWSDDSHDWADGGWGGNNSEAILAYHQYDTWLAITDITTGNIDMDISVETSDDGQKALELHIGLGDIAVEMDVAWGGFRDIFTVTLNNFTFHIKLKHVIEKDDDGNDIIKWGKDIDGMYVDITSVNIDQSWIQTLGDILAFIGPAIAWPFAGFSILWAVLIEENNMANIIEDEINDMIPAYIIEDVLTKLNELDDVSILKALLEPQYPCKQTFSSGAIFT